MTTVRSAGDACRQQRGYEDCRQASAAAPTASAACCAGHGGIHAPRRSWKPVNHEHCPCRLCHRHQQDHPQAGPDQRFRAERGRPAGSHRAEFTIRTGRPSAPMAALRAGPEHRHRPAPARRSALFDTVSLPAASNAGRSPGSRSAVAGPASACHGERQSEAVERRAPMPMASRRRQRSHETRSVMLPATSGAANAATGPADRLEEPQARSGPGLSRKSGSPAQRMADVGGELLAETPAARRPKIPLIWHDPARPQSRSSRPVKINFNSTSALKKPIRAFRLEDEPVRRNTWRSRGRR